MSDHPFTPTYIAMAKAAEEIQAIAPNPFPPGDWYDLAMGRPPGEPSPVDTDELHLSTGLAPWLPRLDQLLGMLAERHGPQFLFIAMNTDLIPGWESMDWHELALSVVMREKYGKRWDSKEGKWVA